MMDLLVFLLGYLTCFSAFMYAFYLIIRLWSAYDEQQKQIKEVESQLYKVKRLMRELGHTNF
jgi:hypothetical protein